LKTALIIFARHPEPGKVKTRLAKTMGNEKALSVYRELLLYTHKITKDIAADKFVFLSEPVLENDFPVWNYPTNRFTIRIQKGNTLGERMLHAFQALFTNGYDHVCIIGSDCITLTQKNITDAFSQLKHHDAVIGPSEDGGYYLLGMKKPHSMLFENKEWSTDKVFASTIEDLRLTHLSFHLLPVLSDIDTEEDWLVYQKTSNIK
jgi:rSAM/selenodomain-associated transferase 1